MGDGITDIAGIEIPSTDPVFLTIVGVHILLGLACVVAGAITILSQKRAGRHPRNGTIYFPIFGAWQVCSRPQPVWPRFAQADVYYACCFDDGLDEYCYWYPVSDVVVTDTWVEYSPMQLELVVAFFAHYHDLPEVGLVPVLRYR